MLSNLTVQLSYPQLQKIMDALSKEPYREVFGLVNYLQAAFKTEVERLNKEEEAARDGDEERDGDIK